MHDAEIVASFLARNEQAIKEVETKYGSMLKALANGILKKPEDVEEIVNDTLLAAWQSIPPNTPKNLKTYLGRIVRGKAISRYRTLTAQKRSAGVPEILTELEDCIPAPADVESTAEANEVSAFINEWLDGLSKEDAALFVRRYWYGESVKELADKLGVSPMKLTQRLYSLRRKLRAFLERRGVSI